MPVDNPLIWSVVIPVKVLALAKTRLAGLADDDRRALALAMAVDTTAAAIASPAVGTVVVVSDDSVVADEVAILGATAIADRPGAGLNRALAAGAEHALARWPAQGVAGLLADLPALRAHELTLALRAAGAVPNAYVPDAAGVGTTLYTARPGTSFEPRFGIRSREEHQRAGAAELSLPGIASLRQDVDTLADLRSAAALGLGRRSAALALQTAD